MPGMQTIWEYIMQLIFPPHCLFCDVLLPPGGCCDDCKSRIEEWQLKGGQRTEHPEKALDHFDGVVSSFAYTGAAAEAVKRYKFDGNRDLFREMAGLICRDIAELLDVAGIELVTCVPSYKAENLHARLLAGGVARCLGKTFDAKLLKKIRATEKQHNLKYEERADNIKDAFAPGRPQKITGKRVLICDDVLTSGNTMNQCAVALRKAGAKAVYGCTFAKAYRLRLADQ